jgi:hypothetical protein
MKTKSLRLLLLAAAGAFAAAAFAADPTGTWKWHVATPNGDIETTLKLESKDGQLTGTYANQFGESAISNAALKDDALAFDVERDLGGNKFVLKYRGKLDGDTIKGTLEAPGFDGGEPRKLDWNAKRAPKEKAPEAKPKS